MLSKPFFCDFPILSAAPSLVDNIHKFIPEECYWSRHSQKLLPTWLSFVVEVPLVAWQWFAWLIWHLFLSETISGGQSVFWFISQRRWAPGCRSVTCHFNYIYRLELQIFGCRSTISLDSWEIFLQAVVKQLLDRCCRCAFLRYSADEFIFKRVGYLATLHV